MEKIVDRKITWEEKNNGKQPNQGKKGEDLSKKKKKKKSHR